VCFGVFCVQCHSESRLVEEPNGVKYAAQRMAKSCIWGAKNHKKISMPSDGYDIITHANVGEDRSLHCEL